jgi:hypothetical protein
VELRRALPLRPHLLIERDYGLVIRKLLTDQPHWVDGHVHAARGANEPDEGLPELPGSAKGHVVVAPGIGPAPLVAPVPVGSLGVLVRAVLRPRRVRGQDAERSLQAPHHADPAHALNQGHTLPFELEGLKVAVGNSLVAGSGD